GNRVAVDPFGVSQNPTLAHPPPPPRGPWGGGGRSLAPGGGSRIRVVGGCGIRIRDNLAAHPEGRKDLQGGPAWYLRCKYHYMKKKEREEKNSNREAAGKCRLLFYLFF